MGGLLEGLAGARRWGLLGAPSPQRSSCGDLRGRRRGVLIKLVGVLNLARNDPRFLQRKDYGSGYCRGFEMRGLSKCIIFGDFRRFSLRTGMINRVWETGVMSAGRAHRHDPGGISFVHNCRESEVAKSVESGGSEA